MARHYVDDEILNRLFVSGYVGFVHDGLHKNLFFPTTSPFGYSSSQEEENWK